MTSSPEVEDKRGKKMESEVTEALKRIAMRYNKSVEEIREDMRVAIDEAMSNPKPEVVQVWQKYKKNGYKPSPEEYIMMLLSEIE